MPAKHFESNQLSAPLRELCDTIAEFYEHQRRWPLVRDLVERYQARGVTHSTTRDRLASMIENGLARYNGEKAGRFVELTESGEMAQRTGRLDVQLARFDGGAHAGARGVELEARQQWIRCLADLLRLRDFDTDYFLPVVGECMDGRRGGKRPIGAGAVALLHACSRWNRPRNGRAVHVEVDLGNGQSEALLRDYFFDEATGLVTLVPRNPAHDASTHADRDVDPRGWTEQWVTYESDAELFAGAQVATAGYVLPSIVTTGTAILEAGAAQGGGQ